MGYSPWGHKESDTTEHVRKTLRYSVNKYFSCCFDQLGNRLFPLDKWPRVPLLGKILLFHKLKPKELFFSANMILTESNICFITDSCKQ